MWWSNRYEQAIMNGQFTIENYQYWYHGCKDHQSLLITSYFIAKDTNLDCCYFPCACHCQFCREFFISCYCFSSFLYHLIILFWSVWSKLPNFIDNFSNFTNIFNYCILFPVFSNYCIWARYKHDYIT